MGFWDEAQGAAVFKHAVLKQYAPIFANKVGKFSDAHRVEIVDGYAGQGRYDNGDPGSPAVFLETAETLKDNRLVHCTFIEEHPLLEAPGDAGAERGTGQSGDDASRVDERSPRCCTRRSCWCAAVRVHRPVRSGVALR